MQPEPPIADGERPQHAQGTELAQGNAKPAIARTNKLAAWSLASSFLGLAMILPIVGSILAILGGKRAVAQIDETGEGGGGIAEAAIVFGWFGLVSSSIGVIGIVTIVTVAARS